MTRKVCQSYLQIEYEAIKKAHKEYGGPCVDQAKKAYKSIMKLAKL